MLFASVDGTATIHSPAQAFFAGFAKRVESGALFGVPSRRMNYVVTRLAPDALEFRAADWPTAINIGLNEVDLSAAGGGTVRYAIRYPRWSRYVFGMSAVIAIALLMVLLLIDVRAYIASHPMSSVSGLSIDTNVAIAWGMPLFWGFVFPWILIAVHKIPLRRAINRLIAEVDAAATR